MVSSSILSHECVRDDKGREYTAKISGINEATKIDIELRSSRTTGQKWESNTKVKAQPQPNAQARGSAASGKILFIYDKGTYYKKGKTRVE